MGRIFLKDVLKGFLSDTSSVFCAGMVTSSRRDRIPTAQGIFSHCFLSLKWPEHLQHRKISPKQPKGEDQSLRISKSNSNILLSESREHHMD